MHYNYRCPDHLPETTSSQPPHHRSHRPHDLIHLASLYVAVRDLQPDAVGLGRKGHAGMAGRATIRAAEAQDLDALLELSEVQRQEHASYQPIFWRPAPDALAQQRPYLAGLLRQQDVFARVAEAHTGVVGFAIGRLTPPPPVYDPGGPTCLIDDFTVANPDLWLTVGLDLLRAVSDAARERGAVQVVVVTPFRDTAKRAALEAGGLGIASEWWTAQLPLS